MIKILYVHGYKGDKYGSSFQSLAKYANAANFAGEKVEMLSFDYDPEEPTKSIRELRLYYYAHDIDLIIGSSLAILSNSGPKMWDTSAIGLFGFLLSAVLGFYIVIKYVLLDK